MMLEVQDLKMYFPVREPASCGAYRRLCEGRRRGETSASAGGRPWASSASRAAAKTTVGKVRGQAPPSHGRAGYSSKGAISPTLPPQGAYRLQAKGTDGVPGPLRARSTPG